MIDHVTHRPLQVHALKDGGASMLLSMAQLPKVRAVLDAHQIYYWEDGVAITLNDGPEVTAITFSVTVDPVMVQRLLDSVP
jgi:hypothetical protein